MRKAFTMVELLIYMALLGLFLIVLTNVLVTILESQAESQAASFTDIDGRFILNRMSYDVAAATSASVSGSTITLNSGTYSVVNGNLLWKGQQLNSFDSSISSFSATKITNPPGKGTVKVSFTILSGARSQDFTTTVGLR